MRTPKDNDDPGSQDLDLRLEENWDRIQAFIGSARDGHPPPVYLSSDIRDAGYKTATIDTNAFPAGFNNLCPGDRADAATTMRDYMDTHHADKRRILLLPENHTRNPYYLHNVHHLSQILEQAGIDHRLGSADPEVVYAVQGTATPDGHVLHYELVVCKNGTLVAGHHEIDLVLSNNDFTTGTPKSIAQCGTPVIPDPSLGWATRSKAKHFAIYNHLARRAAHIAGLEAWRLTVDTEPVTGLDFKKREGLDTLARTVDEMIDRLKKRNAKAGIPDEPRVFIKDDAGTYGMGIFVADSGEQVRTLNSRARQKMDKGKYGHKVQNVIVQEAIPTHERVDDAPAETVAYLIGTRPVGAFMRIHEKRGVSENLNQPGMRFLPLCMHTACDDPQQPDRVHRPLHLREQLVAQLSAVALTHESTPANLQAGDAGQLTLPILE